MGLFVFLTTKKQTLYIYNENKTLFGSSEPLEKKSKKNEKNDSQNLRCALVKMKQR